MATFSISATARKAQATGNGSAGPFSFSFQVNAQAEVDVYVDTTLKTLSTHYTVSLSSDGTGSVSFTTNNYPTSSQTITILGDAPLSRTSVYTSGGNITAAALESDFDTNVMVQQQQQEVLERTVRAPVDDASSVNMTLPNKDARKGKVLGFNATSGNVEVGPSITAVQSLSAVTTSINLLGTAAVVEDMGLLATAAAIEDMGILATSGNVANMAKLATDAIVADMAKLATDAIVADMAILATDDIVADMAILATNDIVTDMNLLATAAIVEDMSLLATSAVIQDMATLAGSGSSPSITNLTASGLIVIADGSNSAPSLTNTGDTNTGLYFGAADTVSFTSGGTKRLDVNTSGVSVTGNVVVSGTVDGRDVASDGTKLDGIEAGSNVTDTANVVAALTAGTNVAIASNGTISATDTNTTYSVGDGGLTQNNFTDADHTKLNGIESSADVTDATNVTAAGALMDSELTNLAAVKAIDQSLVTTASPTFSVLTVTNAIKPKTYQETYVANATGATTTLDLATGTNFSVTLSQNTTFAFSNPPSTGTAFAFTLVITQPAAAKTIAWPASVDWAAATAPDAPGNSEVNAYGFMTRDGGTTYYGFLGGAALG